MNNQDPLLEQAVALHNAGKLGEAAACYRDILIKNPDNVLAIHFLALIAMRNDNAALVLALSDDGIRRQPNFSILHQDRATALRRLSRKEEALAAIQEALRLDPAVADYYETLAAVQRDMRQYQAAVASLETAIHIDSKNPKFFNSAGICCYRMGAFERALTYLDQFIALMPHEATGYNNKANTLKGLHRYREAIQNYDFALKLDPHIFMGRANKGMTHLVLGEFASGWALFEERKPGNMAPERKRFDVTKRWDGRAVPDNATLILYNEQGMGDTLQFCRYIPIVLQRARNVVIEVQWPLRSLIQANWPEHPVISDPEPLPAYNWQCPFMSLPHIFGTTLDNIPFSQPYLQADAVKESAWKKKLPQDGRRKVGLVWAGNPDHMNDHLRSIPLSMFEPLWQLEGFHFIILQQGAKALEQLTYIPSHVAYTVVSDQLTDFSETAAALKQLDVLVSVDTAVAHLAGALGVPAFVLLQFDPDWRWLLERSDSPWYQSLRLFRQKKFGRWDDVVDSVKETLKALNK